MKKYTKFSKEDKWMFWAVELIALVVSVVIVWSIWHSNPLDRYCYWYLSKHPELLDLYWKLKIRQIFITLLGFSIFTISNVLTLAMGKLRFFGKLHPIGKIAVRIFVLVIVLMIFVGISLMLFYIFE